MKKYKEFLKSIIIVMGTQAAVYFITKLFISNYYELTSIINVPLLKGFVYFYGSWYPVIILTAFIIYKHDKEMYYRLIFTMLLGAFLAHLTFIIYPTTITIRPNIEVHNITDFLLDFTYRTDTPVNCLPSVHCLYCFISSYYIIRSKNLNWKYKIFILIYHSLIAISTIFIYQHVIEDIILAFIYTIISITIIYFLKDKLKKVLGFIF